MLTMSALHTRMDAIVLDYMERRPTVNWTSELAKSNYKVTHLDNGVKLEEIYSYYVRGNGVPSSVEHENNIENDSGTGRNRNFPNLPNEVLDQIMKHCNVESLLNFRVLNRSLNILSSEHLQTRPPKTAALNTTINLAKFLSTFENMVPNLGHPLSTYTLHRQLPETNRVLDIVGRHMKVVLLFNTDNILEDLHKMPNVENLTLWEVPCLPDAEGLKAPQNLALRVLKIPHGDFDVERYTLASYLGRWLKIATNLREFEVRLVERINSPLEFFHLIRSNRKLRKITLYDICLRMDSHGNIHLSLDKVFSNRGASEGLESFIALSSKYITNLGIRHDFKVTLPILPNLSSLKLCFDSDLRSSAYRKLPEMFPALKHVTLIEPIRHSFCQCYENTVFLTVDSLNVRDCWKEKSYEMPKFHIIFPRVRSLSLGDHISKKYMDYFSNNFQDITALNFYDAEFTLGVFRDSSLRGKVHWPFSRLKNVRSMKFEPMNDLRCIMMYLLNLTLKKKLPPLDNLTVRFKPEVPPHLTEVDGVEQLFHSLRQLNYHKNLKFLYIPYFD